MTYKKEIFLIDVADEKAHRWSAYFDPRKGILQPSRFREDLAVELILAVLHRRTFPSGFIFRYLNDRKTLLGTVKRFLVDLTIIFLAKLKKSKIVWICHNVDRDTYVAHPLINRLRRGLLLKTSHVIAVTDELLLPHLSEQIGRRRIAPHLAVVPFGPPPQPDKSIPADQSYVEAQIGHIKATLPKKSAYRPMVGICVGAQGGKYIHYRLGELLIRKARSSELPVGLYIAGSKRFISDPEKSAQSFYENATEVIDDNRHVDFSECHLAKGNIFIWRAMDDLSFPSTLLIAAKCGIPVLTVRHTFLGKLVQTYNLGATVSPDFCDLEDALKHLSEWKPSDKIGNMLPGEQRWQRGAEALQQALYL